MAQALRRSPPTAGVPSSRLGHSMWVSWWTKRGLGRFLPFSPTTNFIPPFLHTHHIHFRFISSALVMVRQAWSAGTLATHEPIISGLHRISSLDPTLCWTRVKDKSVPPCGFRGGRNVVWVDFSRCFSRFPWHKFHSTLSPHSSRPCSLISFHLLLWWCDKRGRPARLLFKDHHILTLDPTLYRTRDGDTIL